MLFFYFYFFFFSSRRRHTRCGRDWSSDVCSSDLAVADEQGREREWYKLPYGAVLSVKSGDVVEAGVVVAKWDPHTHPIIAEAKGTAKFVNMDQGITLGFRDDGVREAKGTAKFVNMDQGITVRTQTDELTGLSTMEVIDPKERPAAGKDIRPAIQLIDDAGEEVELPRSEERRVGKECRSRWWMYQYK